MKQNPNSYQFIIDNPGIRLDKFVSENCPGLSRSQAQKLIDDGYVTVNGLMEKASHKTETGEKIEVTIPPPAPSGPRDRRAARARSAIRRRDRLAGGHQRSSCRTVGG